MQRDLRETPLYQQIEAGFRRLAEPGFGLIEIIETCIDMCTLRGDPADFNNVVIGELLRELEVGALDRLRIHAAGHTEQLVIRPLEGSLELKHAALRVDRNLEVRIELLHNLQLVGRLPNRRVLEARLVRQWLAQRHGTGIRRDDLIDACACAVAARDSKDRLPIGEVPTTRGIRMEIWY